MSREERAQIEMVATLKAARKEGGYWSPVSGLTAPRCPRSSPRAEDLSAILRRHGGPTFWRDSEDDLFAGLIRNLRTSREANDDRRLAIEPDLGCASILRCAEYAGDVGLSNEW